MYFIFIKSSSRIEVKIGFIVALSIAFLLVVYRKLTSILGRDFYLSRTKYGFIINNKVRTGNIDRGAICIKEMVSTYSAKAYYDISIRVNGKKIPIAFGASEMDKVAILEGLNYFLSSDGESTGEIQEVWWM